MISSQTRWGMRSVRILSATLIALAATVLAPAGAALAADDSSTTGVATRPATPDGHPDGRTRLSYTADPGQTVKDQVLVGNTGSQRQTFTVYATDAYNTKDGDFALLATADKPKTVGTWVKFDKDADRVQFTLEPNEVRLVPFTVAPPADATPGDHVGGLVASVLEEGKQVTLDRRVATAIFLRVAGVMQPRLSVSSYSAVQQGDWWNPLAGDVKVIYTVSNPGNVALAANLTMNARTWFGIPVTADQGGHVPVLLPGASATYAFTIHGVGQWGYLNPGMTLRPFVDSTESSLQLYAAPVSRDTVTIAIPWMLLILIALGVGVYLFLRWRRKQDAARAQEWMDYVEQTTAAQPEPELAGAGTAHDS